MEILVIVPAYNEEKAIVGVIQDIKQHEPDADILVINDNSWDNTSDTAGNTGAATVIDLPVNLGIGGAVQTGFLYAQRKGYDVAIQFDGDGQHKAEEIKNLLVPLAKNEADVVIGSRFCEKRPGFKSSFTRRIGIKLFEIINTCLIKSKITDNTSGFRAYNQRAISFLAHNYPSDYPEPEAIILLGKNGFRFQEVFTPMRKRLSGSSSISGLKSAYYMVKVILAVLMNFIRPAVTKRIK
ncbi:glycosyltransferase family 2 protein [bacterium]|nr:glycosyltransferase family 2 protein [bacterium]